MDITNPPLWVDSRKVEARLERKLISGFLGSYGVVGPGDLAVDAQPTPSMSVRISAGRALISGGNDSTGAQGCYVASNDGYTNLDVKTVPSGNRIDRIVLRIYDKSYVSGVAISSAVFEVVQGNATTGAPTPPPVPPSSILLADISLSSAVSGISSSNISDTREYASLAEHLIEDIYIKNSSWEPVSWDTTTTYNWRDYGNGFQSPRIRKGVGTVEFNGTALANVSFLSDGAFVPVADVPPSMPSVKNAFTPALIPVILTTSNAALSHTHTELIQLSSAMMIKSSTLGYTQMSVGVGNSVGGVIWVNLSNVTYSILSQGS